jgi:hypothetical protein
MPEMPSPPSTDRARGAPTDVDHAGDDLADLAGEAAGDDVAALGDIDRTLEEALARELVPTAGRDLAGGRSALPLRGSLAETGLPALLGTAYRAGASGRLLIEREGQQHAVDLDCGWAVSATSSDPELGLLAMLVRQRRITVSDRDRVRSEALLSGRRPGAIVVEFGYLKSAELLPALRAQQEEILRAAMALTDGTFTFDPRIRAEPAQIRVQRHPLSLVRSAMESRGEVATVLAPLGGAGARLCLVGGVTAMDLVDQVAADPGDRRLLALFDGVRPLAEVVSRSGLMERSAAALAFALWAGGHLVAADEAQGKRILRDRGLDRERVLARAALARVGDYFEILGVSPAASAPEIARAVAQIEQELQAAADLEGPAGLREELESVRRSVDEAARVLGDERLRPLYQTAAGIAAPAAPSPPAARPAATAPVAGRGGRRRS